MHKASRRRRFASWVSGNQCEERGYDPLPRRLEVGATLVSRR
jgi:hypothetical protein